MVRKLSEKAVFYMIYKKLTSIYFTEKYLKPFKDELLFLLFE